MYSNVQIESPNTELLRNEFGYAKNQYVEVAVDRGYPSQELIAKLIDMNI